MCETWYQHRETVESATSSLPASKRKMQVSRTINYRIRPEHLLGARPFARDWEYSGKQHSFPQGVYGLVGKAGEGRVLWLRNGKHWRYLVEYRGSGESM